MQRSSTGSSRCAPQVDVHDLDVDFYCAGGKKWIGNPFGMGFMYIKKSLIGEILPDFYSYFNAEVLPGYNNDHISYLEDPKRHAFDPNIIRMEGSSFEIGGYANYLGAIGLEEAIHVQLEIGPKNIEEKILGLNRRLRKGLNELGVHISGSQEEAHLSGIVSFSFDLTKGNKKEKRLMEYLTARNIVVSLRCCTGVGGIRVSMHYYNRADEIDTLLENIKAFMQQDKD